MKKMNEIKKAIKSHYSMQRDPTEQECLAEIENLKRRKAKGFLDDFDSRLYYRLGPLT